MTIDVIIPTFNGGAFIRETLASVFMQTCAPSRIIVVDDGSTDGSFDIVSRVPGVCAVKSPSKGAAAARNAGLRLSNAPLVAFLDHDDLWHPGHLARLAALMEEYPSYPVAASGMMSFDSTRPPRFDVRDGSSYLFDPWEIYPTHDLACTPSLTLFRRETLLAAGGWPEEFPSKCDYALWMKFAITRPILMTRAKTLAYRIHTGSITASLKKDPGRHVQISLEIDDLLKEAFCASRASGARKDAVRRRNRISHHYAEIVRLLGAGDRAGLRDRAADLAQALAPEPFSYRQSLLYRTGCLYRDLCRSRGIIADDDGYGALLDAWPESDAVSRGVLYELLVSTRPGLPFYMRYYAKRPADLGRLKPFAAAVYRKFVPAPFRKLTSSGEIPIV